jgi:hypothetical protein
VARGARNHQVRTGCPTVNVIKITVGTVNVDRQIKEAVRFCEMVGGDWTSAVCKRLGGRGRGAKIMGTERQRYKRYKPFWQGCRRVWLGQVYWWPRGG